MNRRDAICLLGAAAMWPISNGVAQIAETARIGYIGTNRETPLGKAIFEAFVDELGVLGFIDGKNLAVDFRSIEQPLPSLSSDARELVRSNVNLIVTDGTEAALRAAVGASKTLPVVMVATNFDPLKTGYVRSLSQPGGNVTGVFLRQTELAEKQTELLTQTFPDRKRLAILWDAVSQPQFEAAEARAKALRLLVQPLKLEQPPYDFDAAFRTLVKGSPQMLLVLSSPFFVPSRVHIAELAVSYALPAMFIFKTYVQGGGLMSYGVDYVAMHRQMATYAARILHGAKPADLPIEQPNRFEMTVNLTTAKNLGISIPQALLLRADDVIR